MSQIITFNQNMNNIKIPHYGCLQTYFLCNFLACMKLIQFNSFLKVRCHFIQFYESVYNAWKQLHQKRKTTKKKHTVCNPFHNYLLTDSKHVAMVICQKRGNKCWETTLEREKVVMNIVVHLYIFWNLSQGKVIFY